MWGRAMKRTRLKRKERRDQILKTACKIAAKSCYKTITRDEIAYHVGVAKTLLNYYFTTMEDFRVALMYYAVNTKNIPIITQGILHNDKIALAADTAIVKEAYNNLLDQML
jgi:AcrR family transcriptional regulator